MYWSVCSNNSIIEYKDVYYYFVIKMNNISSRATYKWHQRVKLRKKKEKKSDAENVKIFNYIIERFVRVNDRGDSKIRIYLYARGYEKILMYFYLNKKLV